MKIIKYVLLKLLIWLADIIIKCLKDIIEMKEAVDKYYGKMILISFFILVLFIFGCEKITFIEDEPDPTCLNCHPKDNLKTSYGCPYGEPYGKYK